MLRDTMSAFGVEVQQSQITIIPAGASKADALRLLIDAVEASGAVRDRAAFERAVNERESVMSTGIGGGIAIPHVRIPEVEFPALGVGVAPHGVEFDTLDKKPVYVMVLFATPQGQDKVYLGLLAQVMVALKDQEFFQELTACDTTEAAYAVISE